MTENSGEIELGDLSGESFDFKHVIWKIPNFFSLPNQVDYKVHSPSFSFGNATWKLEMCPFGQTFYRSEGFIDLLIVRLDTEISKHKVYFKFFFKTRRGKEFESNSNFVLFSSKYSVLGVLKYLKKSIFIEKRNIVAPNGVLTIVCQLRTKKVVLFDRHSQTESSVAVSGINTLRDFKELYFNQEDCDVIIKVKGVKFQAHKNILKARSPVFASTFRNDMKEKVAGTIDIKDCELSSFSDFLCFLYCGNIDNLSAENVFSLFMTADKYDVKDLRMECIEFMKCNLSVDIFCDTIALALQYSEKELIEIATDFYKDNLKEIIQTVKWQSFLTKYPIQSNELLIKALVNKK